ncbi:Kelch repeat-containing protein, partial [Jiulongibacter sediminis]
TGEPSLLLDVKSDHQGILIPRMTETERDAMPGPPSGTQIFNETQGSLEILGLGWIDHFGLKIPQAEIDSNFLEEESWKLIDNDLYQYQTNVTFVFDSAVHFINTGSGFHSVYYPKTDTWSIADSFPTPMAPPTSVTQGFQIGNTGYILGLWEVDPSKNLHTQRLWAYNPATDTWTPKASCPQSRAFASSFVINNKAYVLGGFTTNTINNDYIFLKDFYEYNPIADSWKRLTDFYVPIYSAATCSLNGKGYTIFGALKSGFGEIYSSNLYEYDPVSDSWSFRSSLSLDKGRLYALGFSMNGKIYGGFGNRTNDPGSKRYDLWEYDPNINEWTEIATTGIHYISTEHSVSVIGDKAYMGGGPFYVYHKKKYRHSTEVNEAQNINTTIWNRQNNVLQTDSQHIGIGTSEPLATLDVNGSLKVDNWFSEQLTENGFVNMAGVLLQWGTASYSTNNIQNVVFPTPFQTLYSVTANLHSEANNGSGANAPVKLVGTSPSSFNIAGTKGFSGDAVSKVRWIAVGKPN